MVADLTLSPTYDREDGCAPIPRATLATAPGLSFSLICAIAAKPGVYNWNPSALASGLIGKIFLLARTGSE